MSPEPCGQISSPPLFSYAWHYGRTGSAAARLHRHWARMVNAYRGRWDGFWAQKQASLVELCDAEAVWDKRIYVAANPIKHGLVERVSWWPGLKVLPHHILGGGRVFERPDFFFRDEQSGGKMPAEVLLRPVKPPHFADVSYEDYVKKAEADIATRCREHRRSIRERGGRFMGVEAVREQDWREKPKTRAPRRVRHPHISAKDPAVRRTALCRRKDSLRAHHEALTVFNRRPIRKGSVVFPYGTWQMRTRHNVRCHPPRFDSE